MAEQEAAPVDEEPEAAQADEAPDANAAADVDPEEAGVADAVDNRAAELTGASGSADADAPIADINRGAVEAAEEHLDDTNLAADRDTLKKLQKDM